ncbi:MAG: hypothetical protein QNJ88_07350 [Acidimicrobiia bacterium]|nr:hypothetical protein [Acidimicrobiia bacterium]
MSTEQRLIEALEATDSFAPSPDLWARIVHSIEEDRRHRRRVRTTAAVVALLVLLMSTIVWIYHETATQGSRIDWRAMEAIEVGTLTMLVAALGPAIRRFGRSYAADLFLSASATGDRLLALLDLAYYLVFAGYILMTTRFAAPATFVRFEAAAQIKEAAMRTGGLLLSMGILHALALVSLPLIAFVFNSGRCGTKLPRWVVVLVVAAAIGILSALPSVFIIGLGQ